MINPAVQAWREAGKHLPDILRDFHEQKDIFVTMHTMLGPPNPRDTVKQPSCVEGHAYTIDCFLWFMARHGYTLQRTRTKLPFDSLAANVAAIKAARNEQFQRMLSGHDKTNT